MDISFNTSKDDYIFISYSSADKEKLSQITTVLDEVRVMYWYDKGENGLTGGSEWQRELPQMIDGAASVLLLLSSHSAESTYVKNEITYAVNHSKSIIVLKLESFELPKDIEFMLGRFHMIDLNGEYIKKLVKALPLRVFENGKKPGVDEQNGSDYNRITTGQTVDGKFLITEVIRSEEHLDVFRSTDTRTDTKAIVTVAYSSKTYHPYLPDDIMISKRIDNPNIARIVDAIEYNGYVMTIMTDCRDGVRLGEWIKTEGIQNTNSIINIAGQICNALNCLYERKILGVLKKLLPDSFLIDPSGHVLLFDYVLSYDCHIDPIEQQRNNNENFYVSPERIAITYSADGSHPDEGFGITDGIYSVGSIIYALASGVDPSKPPYAVYPISDKNPDVDDRIIEIIEKCRNRDPQKRYQSFEELSRALDRLVNGGSSKKRLGLFKRFSNRRR